MDFFLPSQNKGKHNLSDLALVQKCLFNSPNTWLVLPAEWNSVSLHIIQGDPPKMPPTKMLITSVQRFASYLVHSNFSLCRIIPQSFQFVCQMVRLLCYLQNVFQMTPLALQAHLQATREIVNDTNAFLVCLQRQGGHLEHILEITSTSDHLTYRLETLWKDPTQTEVNVHQIWSKPLHTCRS